MLATFFVIRKKGAAESVVFDLSGAAGGRAGEAVGADDVSLERDEHFRRCGEEAGVAVADSEDHALRVSLAEALEGGGDIEAVVGVHFNTAGENRFFGFAGGDATCQLLDAIAPGI